MLVKTCENKRARGGREIDIFKVEFYLTLPEIIVARDTVDVSLPRCLLRDYVRISSDEHRRLKRTIRWYQSAIATTRLSLPFMTSSYNRIAYRV